MKIKFNKDPRTGKKAFKASKKLINEIIINNGKKKKLESCLNLFSCEMLLTYLIYINNFISSPSTSYTRLIFS